MKQTRKSVLVKMRAWHSKEKRETAIVLEWTRLLCKLRQLGLTNQKTKSKFDIVVQNQSDSKSDLANGF